jgi:thymidine kinase
MAVVYGEIKLYLGCMFSGKTSSIIDKYVSDGSCLGIKPLIDTRGDTSAITSHNGASIPAITLKKLCLIPAASIPPVRGRVLIDE